MLPPHARRTELHLAVGAIDGFQIGDVTYVNPEHGEFEQLFPRGRFNRMWDLSGDFNASSDDPTSSTGHLG